MRRVFRLVPGTGYQVSGTWHLGPGTRYRINAEGRIPSTEDRAGRPGTGKRAHRVCILTPYPASGIGIIAVLPYCPIALPHPARCPLPHDPDLLQTGSLAVEDLKAIGRILDDLPLLRDSLLASNEKPRQRRILGAFR